MKNTFLFTILCICLNTYAIAQISAIKDRGYVVVDSIKGAYLFKKIIKVQDISSDIFLQIIDIQQVKIEHFASLPQSDKQPEGIYCQAKGFTKSPFFKMYDYKYAVKKVKNLYKNQLWGIVNAAFFEQYGDSTQLAFPLKINGKMVSAGSSPYGPQKTPKHDYFKNITLKALIWSDTMVAIQNYDVQTGYPLINEEAKNGLVSYNFRDHPAKALYQDPSNRYHVLGVLNKKLYILTVNKTSLENAAQLLQSLGIAKDNIMTIDGGVSVFIHNCKKGTLQLPSNKEKELPHYLVFVKK